MGGYSSYSSARIGRSAIKYQAGPQKGWINMHLVETHGHVRQYYDMQIALVDDEHKTRLSRNGKQFSSIQTQGKTAENEYTRD
jgi:hypothetical protein